MWKTECGCSRTCKGSRVRHACPQYSLGDSHAGNGSPYGAGCVLGIREQPCLVNELGRRQVVEHGTRDMPVWGAIFEEEGKGEPYPAYHSLLQSRFLVDYLATLQER